MSSTPEEPAFQNYPAMPSAQPGPLVQVKPGVSGLAITSFVLGVVGAIGGVLSVIFGIVALVDIRRTRQRGKGLAVAGIVLSGAWMLAVLVFLGAAFFHGVQQGVQARQSTATASYNFQPGQCFDRPQTSQAAASTPVDCAKPHLAEVFATEPVPGTSYPGDSAVKAIGHTKCHADSVKWLTPGMNYPDIVVNYLYPTAGTWARGDRSVKCFYRRADGLPMNGHVKDTGLPYTDDQRRYLDAVGPYDTIVDEEDGATGWTAERDVVARSVPVVQHELDVLQAGPWPTNAQATVASLIADKKLELDDRKKAAAATDEDGLDEALDDAHDHDGSDEDRAIRTELHLPPR